MAGANLAADNVALRKTPNADLPLNVIAFSLEGRYQLAARSRAFRDTIAYFKVDHESCVMTSV